MATKFHDLFKGFGAKIDELASSWKTSQKREEETRINSGDITRLVNELKQLGIYAEKSTEDIVKLESELDILYQNPKRNAVEIALKEREIEKIRKDALEVESKIQELQKDIIDKEEKRFNDELKRSTSWNKAAGDFNKAEEKFKSDLEKIIKQRATGNIKEQDFMEKRNKLMKEAQMLGNIKNAFAATDNGIETLTNGIANGAGKIFGMIFPELEMFAVVVEEVVGRAVKMFIELNDALVKIQRTTGGIVNAAALGYNATGTLQGGMESLRTTMAKNNIDLQDYGDALNRLFQGPMGQVVGMKTNLKASGDELQKYALASAKMMKLWGTDISGAVQGLTMNYGLSIKGATDATEAFAYSAKRLGLNMSTAMKNLQRVTELTNKFYFKSLTSMTNMAMLATKLGVSVDSLTEGALKMTSVTDLFSKQQEMAALELGNYASNLAKIYAARATGRTDEAARLEMMSLYKDIKGRGFVDRRGQITAQGITTMQAAGMGPEQIDALNRMSKVMKDTGLTIEEQMAPLKNLSPEKRDVRLKNERENRTMGESVNIITKKLWSGIIDPIAAILGPIIKSWLGAVESIVDALQEWWGFLQDILMLGGVIPTIIGWFEGFYDAISSTFQDLKDSIASIREKIKPVVDFVSKAFGWLGKTIGFVIGWITMLPVKILIVSFKMLGWIIGLVVDGLKLLWDGIVYIGEGLAKVFKPVIQIFKDFWNTMNDFIDWLVGWIPGLGKPKETAEKVNKGISDQVWREIFGDVKGGGATATPATPTPDGSVLDKISREDTSAKRMKELNEQAFDLTKDKNYVKVNVTTNTNVSGIYSEQNKKTMNN